MNTLELLQSIVKRGKISKKELHLLKLRSNKNRIDCLTEIPQNERQDFYDGIVLDNEYQKVIFDSLFNRYKTPTGKERKNNPFGFREQEILDSGDVEIYFCGLYNYAIYGNSNFTPIFSVYSKGFSSFEYYFSNNEIHIIG